MPKEDIAPKSGMPVDPAKHNAEIARKVRDQDISGQPTATGEFGEATEALDKLAAQVKPPADKVEPKPADKIEPKPADKIEPKPADKVEPKPADKIEPKPAGPDEATLKRAEELFKGSPSLPPNASPKSAEAFSAIKVKAAQELSAREQEIEALKKQIEDAKKPSSEQLQQQKELEEHRQWRLKMDVDFDPRFKEFDKAIAQNREFIYAQLGKSPVVTPEIIEQIKKYGGPDMINLTKLFESIKDPTLQRLVEAKVADIEMAKYNKEQAIGVAKTNLSKYLEERQAEVSKAATVGRQETEAKLTGLLKNLDWFIEKKADASADEPTKKEVADHNKFITELRQNIATTLQDDSPEMRAILITGMVQLFQLQRRVPALESQLEAARKELTEVKAKWDAVKSSTRSRLQESQAPSGGSAVTPKTGIDINQRPADALDALARDVMEKRAQAAATA